MERQALRVYAQRSVYQSRLAQARHILTSGLRESARPYVACSFGKDSAVLLDLALQARPSIDVRFLRWPESELLDRYGPVIAAWFARHPALALTILDLDRASLGESVPDRWQQLEQIAPTDGYLIGLRAEESGERRMTLRTHGPVHRRADGVVRIAPLAWWTTRDIAAYCLDHDLPLLDAYAADGIATRTSARVPRTDRGIRDAAIERLKARDLASYNALRMLYPELA
jgi:3'-phosphoadenosine 5'-phosphosulfate sulfotransferase (PAPS reductase)/FAD synthetase